MFLFLVSGCGTHPYNTQFKCPPTYGGMCESLPEAYEDSVHDIDPRKFDKEWLRKRQKWEKKHVELLMARQAAGIDIKTVTPPEKLFKNLKGEKDGSKTSQAEKPDTARDSENRTSEEKGVTGKEEKVEPPTYRELVFRELKNLLVEPDKPFVVPPKTVRILVLSNLTKDDSNRDLYISPHYVYFFLDEPKFLLHKYTETIPFDPENPFLRR